MKEMIRFEVSPDSVKDEKSVHEENNPTLDLESPPSEAVRIGGKETNPPLLSSKASFGLGELHVSVQRHAQSKIISPRIIQCSSSSVLQGSPLAIGITALLDDHNAVDVDRESSSPLILQPTLTSSDHPVLTTNSSVQTVDYESEIANHPLTPPPPSGCLPPSPPPPPSGWLKPPPPPPPPPSGRHKPPPPPPPPPSCRHKPPPSPLPPPPPPPPHSEGHKPPPPPPPPPSEGHKRPPPPPPPPSGGHKPPPHPPPPSLGHKPPSLLIVGPPESGGGLSKVPSSVGSGNVIPAPPLLANGKLQGRTSTMIKTQLKKTLLKPYHWFKLTRVIQGSIWAEAQKPEEGLKAPEFDMSELEKLFSTSSDQGRNSVVPSRRGSGVKPQKVQLIDLKRAYNCEIMLTRVKVPLSDLMNSILALDDSALNVEQVDSFIKFCPKEDEIKLLQNYEGDPENLGKCEKFFLELMKVPRIDSKLRVFSFKIKFFSQVSDLRSSLNIVNAASQEVRSSVKLKRIMQTILLLGNALNQGTARGSAVGFRLDSLLKLTETRARNNKLTLMHYLCKVLAEKLPEVLDFHRDLRSLEAASKVQLKHLAEEMKSISEALKKAVQELTASQNDGPVSKHFCKTLKEFLSHAEAEVRSLNLLVSEAGKNADDLAFYFGEEPARCPFEQVVSTLLNFVRMFVRAHEENCKQIEYEMKKAQREAEIEKAKANDLTQSQQ